MLLQSSGLSHHRLHVPVDGGVMFLRDGGDGLETAHAARMSGAALQVSDAPVIVVVVVGGGSVAVVVIVPGHCRVSRDVCDCK